MRLRDIASKVMHRAVSQRICIMTWKGDRLDGYGAGVTTALLHLSAMRSQRANASPSQCSQRSTRSLNGRAVQVDPTQDGHPRRERDVLVSEDEYAALRDTEIALPIDAVFNTLSYDMDGLH